MRDFRGKPWINGGAVMEHEIELEKYNHHIDDREAQSDDRLDHERYAGECEADANDQGHHICDHPGMEAHVQIHLVVIQFALNVVHLELLPIAVDLRVHNEVKPWLSSEQSTHHYENDEGEVRCQDQDVDTNPHRQVTYDLIMEAEYPAVRLVKQDLIAATVHPPANLLVPGYQKQRREAKERKKVYHNAYIARIEALNQLNVDQATATAPGQQNAVLKHVVRLHQVLPFQMGIVKMETDLMYGGIGSRLSLTSKTG